MRSYDNRILCLSVVGLWKRFCKFLASAVTKALRMGERFKKKKGGSREAIAEPNTRVLTHAEVSAQCEAYRRSKLNLDGTFPQISRSRMTPLSSSSS